MRLYLSLLPLTPKFTTRTWQWIAFLLFKAASTERKTTVQLSCKCTFKPCWKFLKRKGLRWQCDISLVSMAFSTLLRGWNLWGLHGALMGLGGSLSCLSGARKGWQTGEKNKVGAKGSSKGRDDCKFVALVHFRIQCVHRWGWCGLPGLLLTPADPIMGQHFRQLQSLLH